MHIFVTILILIVMLGILVSAHEAGHLFMAKRFGVYCDEYSIGFGPKLFSHKRKGAETTFSIRAIPLGGYVSMYGEEMKNEGDEAENDDRFKDIPKERSLEGVSAWKRCLILIAGIAVNLFISFLFCLIYAVSFPSYQSYQSFLAKEATVNETSLAKVNTERGRYETSLPLDSGNLYIGVAKENNKNGEEVQNDPHPWVYGFYIQGEESVLGKKEEQDAYRLVSPGLAISKDQKNYGFILDTDATINDSHVIVTYYPASEKTSNNLYSNISLYSPLQDSSKNFIASSTDSLERELGMNYYPDFSNKIELAEGDKLTFRLSLANKNNAGEIVATIEQKEISIVRSSTGYEGPSLSTYSNEYWAPFGERLLSGCIDWVNFFPMIGEGLKSLFFGNFNSVGGVVAMGAGLSQLSNYMGWGKTFFYYGGLVSLNLAIFNLLPFPGLDGWGLLVTVIEKLFKKKIPQKAKAIVSFIGLSLLMLLAIFITIKDVIGLF